MDKRRAAYMRGAAIFAKAFKGIPVQQAAKTTRTLMPATAPAILRLSLNSQQGKEVVEAPYVSAHLQDDQHMEFEKYNLIS